MRIKKAIEKAPISTGMPTSATNHVFKPGPSEELHGEQVQVVYVPQRAEITEVDLRVQALDKAIYICGANRMAPEEVVPVAEEYLDFLRGE